MERLQVRAGSWRVDAEWVWLAIIGRVPILIVVSNSSTILGSSLFTKLANICPGLIGCSRNSRILNRPIHVFLEVVAARADVLLRECFHKMLLPFSLAILPFDSATWRG